MRDQLAAESAAKRKALEDQLNAKLAESERSIGATKSQAMTHVTEIATTAAAEIVAQITGKPADAQKIAQAVAAAKA
jgi:F-type H+-transporting ATPase subunit b